MRLLVARPGLTIGRLLTVTIVVTAVTAVFSVANATMLRPLPFPDADRLVRVYLQPPGTSGFADANPFDPFEFARFREHVRSLEAFEGIWTADRAITGEGDPESVPAGRVSSGFFAMFGARLAFGRLFTAEEVDDDARLVVVSYRYWVRRLKASREVLGRPLIIDREAHVVIGVTDPLFDPGFADAELWTPLHVRRGAGPTGLTSVQVTARLRRDRDLTLVRQELSRVLDAIRPESPARLTGYTVDVVDLREWQFGSRRQATMILLVAVAALALVAIANLTNLTLADVLLRRREFAMRAALGGSRLDLVVPEIVQGLTIAGIGGGLGLGVAALAAPAAMALDPWIVARGLRIAVDARVATCAFGVATVVMIAAVVIPAYRLAGPAIVSHLAEGAQRTVGGRRARRPRAWLLAAQTALTLVLLTSSALVAKSLNDAAGIAPGFDSTHLVTAQLRLAAPLFPTELSRATYVDRLVTQLKQTPGVVNAATTLNPFVAGSGFQTLVRLQIGDRPDGQPQTVQYRRVSPDYFATMGIAVLQGRVFDRHDWVGSQLVAIVSRGFANRFWPDQDPLGRRLQRGASPAWYVVVGVVDDVRDNGLDRPPVETLYTPYFQGSNVAAPVALVVRTVAEPSLAIRDIKRAVWAVDPLQPLAKVSTMDWFLATSLGPHRFRALLVTTAAVIGLVLAIVGIYAVTVRSTAERTREVGVRLALGGRPAVVWWTVAWGSLRGVAAGAVAGMLVSRLTGAALTALLPEVQSGQWVAMLVAAGALLLAGSLAAVTASRAAVSAGPIRALHAPR